MSDLIGGAPAAAPTGTPPAGTPPAGPVTTYPENFPAEFHGDPSIAKFIDKESGDLNYGNMMTSLIHAQKMVGANKMVIPSKDAGEDEWATVFKSLGQPEREEYKLGLEGVDENDEVTKGFMDVAHKAGVLPNQAKAIVEYFNGAQKGQEKTFSDEQTALKQVSLDKLQSDWGDNYQEKLNIADQSFSKLFDEDLGGQLKDAGFLADPLFIRTLAAIGEKVLDDTTLDQSKVQGTGFAPQQEMRDEYQSLMRDPAGVKGSKTKQDRINFLIEQSIKQGFELV